ncbi:hypothetical protein NQ314_008537 [Rhamnusium bicolor]|uniref:Uncharacterized protein n=1 Tax=Rhamnusium bicolor TaxID=1586634 RepID=A0AAV8Y9A4_9CUCU|nr:hypothetical protein NQ314_008537 [Rhamnusium bicolor]
MDKMMKLVFFAGLVAVAFGDVRHLLTKRQTGERYAAILRSDNEVYPDGSYQYAYDTENGISAQESGKLKAIGPDVGTSAQGSYQYTSPEGILVQIQYIADENGFQPVGNVIPTPPPIPEAILKSLQYNAAHPEPSYTAQPTYSPFRKF